MAHVLQLPGCTSSGDTEKEALGKIDVAIINHLNWLKSHGIEAPSPRKVRTCIAQIVRDVPELGISGGMVATFRPDHVPPTEKELLQYFCVMCASRQDLLELVRGLKLHQLEWKLEVNERSIEEILRHISNAEWWYISRIVGDPDILLGRERQITLQEPKDVFERLHLTRELALRKYALYPRALWKRRFVPRHYCRHKNEVWTFRKALRRTIEHEREHYFEIEATIKAFRRRRRHHQRACPPIELQP